MRVYSSAALTSSTCESKIWLESMLLTNSCSFLLLYGRPSLFLRDRGPGWLMGVDGASAADDVCGVGSLLEAAAPAPAVPAPAAERGMFAGGGLVMGGVPKTGFVANPEESVGRGEGKFSGLYAGIVRESEMVNAFWVGKAGADGGAATLAGPAAD